MTGREWDELAIGLVTGRHREMAVEDALRRLVSELAIADGHGWHLRLNAAHRIARNPLLEPTMVRVCVDIATDPINQIPEDSFSILEGMGHRYATRTILDALRRPNSGRVQQAGWWTAAEKLSRGHFTNQDKEVLVREAVQVVRDGSPGFVHSAALDVLQRLSTTQAAAWHDTRLGTTTVRSVSGSDTSAALARQLTVGAGYGDSADDPVLAQLTAEMLSHPHLSRRIIAAHTIAATPYRELVGQRLTRALHQRDLQSSAPLATAAVQALMALGDQAAKVLAERLALDSTIPEQVRRTAIRASAHIAHATPSPQSFWHQLIRAAADGSADASAAVYAAGIALRDAELSQIERDPRFPTMARAAATWWLAQPRHARLSAAI
ncbi:hypothetical protein [Catellatospora methionotrophica]|uniref:hypothetical protein n=1 Tax=Catellatospora methionotrophica TaxID=121620 RepID=UPI0033FF5D4F